MNKKRSMLALLCAVLLTWGAGQAWGVVQRLPGTHEAIRESDDGESGEVRVPMANSAVTFCILSAVTVRDTDTRDEFATCAVEDGGGVWELVARTGEASDQAVYCQAICFTIN